MLTPAQAHFQRTMAQRAGLTDDSQSQTVRTAHEQILHRLRLAQARLKGIQSKAAKAELKKTLLPDFSGWIDGTLESDSGRQDEVIVTLMVWAVDCGDLPLALRIGEYVVRHNLSTPDSFGRDAATLLTEEICNPVLTLAGTDQDADLSGYIAPLDTLWTIVTNRDMPDEVRAKLCKARSFSRRALTDADSVTLSLKLLREAMHLNPNAGVKREIATLSRAVKKLTSSDGGENNAENKSTAKTATTKTATKKAGKKSATKATATRKSKKSA
ncbi:phage terminase small subunit [Escherichia coli]|uniref:phage terminase small subunit n=1 Tax=Escherichia coli TaxID=562 RepID=UPI0010AC5270|nr:phage terminase small subunit [Escherichia coli]EFA4193288.1 terminase [Escherichia coli O96]TJN36499.1 terminase [Escherichia coli]